MCTVGATLSYILEIVSESFAVFSSEFLSMSLSPLRIRWINSAVSLQTTQHLA
jgi:hypothetical protein